MNIEEWLKNSVAKLKGTSSTAELDSEVILAHHLSKDRAWLYAHPEFILQRSDLRKLDSYVKRRVGHEPVAYIVGKTEFYGREFAVSADTLEPRPETETMIELLLCDGSLDKAKVIDVGTGSGSIIITACLELSDKPELEFYGIDISKPALKIAGYNAANYKSKIEFLLGDLLEPMGGKLDMGNVIILANLPYVPNDHTINEAARHEPDIAIFGGTDGLDLYREMFGQINFKCSVFTESLPPQHEDLRGIAKSHGFTQTLEQDFIQVFRNN